MFSVSSLFSALIFRAVVSTIEHRKNNPRTMPGVVDHARSERTFLRRFTRDFSAPSSGADGRAVTGVIDDTSYHRLQAISF
jgi:hypothetical protein